MAFTAAHLNGRVIQVVTVYNYMVFFLLFFFSSSSNSRKEPKIRLFLFNFASLTDGQKETQR